jgi:preprotein translocase subunit SecA
MTTPTQEYRRTDHKVPRPLLKGLDAAVYAMAGAYRRRQHVLTELRAQAEQIDAQAKLWGTLTDHMLQERLKDFNRQFRRGGKQANDAVIPALAAIREAADRQLGLRPFVVQLMGALALQRGYLAEMATGEGKTLTAGLAAILAGWTNRPCHVVTVNDYLVQRDAEWLQPLYHFCSVRVGFVTGLMSPEERRHGYGCDVTYTTSKELLADFLRDRLRVGALLQPERRLIREMLRPHAAVSDGLVLRGLHTAIVDEADSILIDEAVTPLIISTTHRNESLREACRVAQDLVATLEPKTHYATNLRYREVELTEAGRRDVAARCSCLPGLWRGTERRNELVRQALVAREFFLRDKQYIIIDGKVIIVDEFTGRPMPQRTWREGLHQAIEAKEGLEITDPSENIARLSFQRFFRCFHKLSGMTGTAREAANELWHMYGLPVISIPTNRPCIRKHWPDRIFDNETSKWRAVVDEVARRHAAGQPVLVGTRSVAASERLAGFLAERHLECRVLNAVRLKEEAEIVALAGHRGRITIATNMAGRGTDIKLERGVPELGGLHVLATERHESGRVDRQLFGRSARQGDPGSAQAFVSLEDELFRRYVPASLQHAVLAAWRRRAPGAYAMARAAFALAQRHAQRLAFNQRKAVLRMDTWLEEGLSFAGVNEV